MKKALLSILSLILAATTAISFAACGGSGPDDTASDVTSSGSTSDKDETSKEADVYAIVGGSVNGEEDVSRELTVTGSSFSAVTVSKDGLADFYATITTKLSGEAADKNGGISCTPEDYIVIIEFDNDSGKDAFRAAMNGYYSEGVLNKDAYDMYMRCISDGGASFSSSDIAKYGNIGLNLPSEFVFSVKDDKAYVTKAKQINGDEGEFDYYGSGVMKSSKISSKDTGVIETTYYENGAVMTEKFERPDGYGYEKEYYENGNLKTLTERDLSGISAVMRYDENGTLLTDGSDVDESVPEETPSSIVGTWVSESVSFVRLEGLTDESSSLYRILSGVYVSFIFVFNDDETVTLQIREQDTLNTLKKALKDYAKSTVTLEEVKMYGYKSVDKFAEDYSCLYDYYYSTCQYKYRLEDGILYLWSLDYSESDPIGYYTVSMSGRRMTLDEYSGGELYNKLKLRKLQGLQFRIG